MVDGEVGNFSVGPVVPRVEAEHSVQDMRLLRKHEFSVSPLGYKVEPVSYTFIEVLLICQVFVRFPRI